MRLFVTATPEKTALGMINRFWVRPGKVLQKLTLPRMLSLQPNVLSKPVEYYHEDSFEACMSQVAYDPTKVYFVFDLDPNEGFFKYLRNTYGSTTTIFSFGNRKTRATTPDYIKAIQR